MLTALLLSNALAADLHVDVKVGDWSESIVHVAGEPYTGRFGPVSDGKKEIAFEITWTPSPHSVVDNGYLMEVTVCRVWAKGKKKDRDCITEKLIARPQSEDREPAVGEVKLSDKWDFRLEAWATGDDIPSTEMPMEAPAPEPAG
jgi:hypothetical protein